MKARSTMIGVIILLATPLSAAAPSGAAHAEAGSAALSVPNLNDTPSVSYQSDFETTIRPWWAGTNDRSAKATVSRQLGDNGCGDGGKAYAHLQSYTPVPDDKSAEANADGAMLPIRTWAAITLSAPVGPVNVDVAWSTRSIAGCEGCVPALFVGTQLPDERSNFRMSLPALTSQWQNRSHQTSVLYGNRGKIYVAIGWLGSNASVALDCISVSITPQYDYTYEFETGVEPWQPIELNGDGATLDQSLGDAGCGRTADAVKTWHAALRNYWGPAKTVQGAGPEVPIPPYRLMQAGFPSSGHSFSLVTITWSAQNKYGCGGCTPMVYVGNAPLSTSDQLKPLAARFADYWQRMGYETTITTAVDSRVYVALGWMEPSGANPPRAVGYDCLNVHIEPEDLVP